MNSILCAIIERGNQQLNPVIDKSISAKLTANLPT